MRAENHPCGSSAGIAIGPLIFWNAIFVVVVFSRGKPRKRLEKVDNLLRVIYVLLLPEWRKRDRKLNDCIT